MAAVLFVASGCSTIAPADEATETTEVSAALEPQVVCNEVLSLPGSTALATCFARVAPGGFVLLPSGASVVLDSPIAITKPMILATAGKSAGQACDPRTADGCATINTSPTSAAFSESEPTLDIASSDVSLRNLNFNFHLRSVGVRVRAAVRFSAFDSSFQNARHSALQVNPDGGAGAVIERNLFFNNGARDPAHSMFSDGLTFLDGSGARIVGNRFFDNTDVQLILGGCTNCIIASNDIRNSGNAARVAFAGLALHSFRATTSGDFTGSDIAGNVIECTAARSCGFGFYLGDYAWFPGQPSNPVNGGHIHGNSISNAHVGMYIDHAVNTRIDDDNTFFILGGTFPCMLSPRRYTAAVLSLVEDPRVGGRIQLDFSTALNLFVNHRLNQNLDGCIPTGY